MKVILFGNDKCGSCREWKPVFDKLMKEYQLDNEFIDIEKDKINKEKYDIHGIPMTIFFDDDGNEIGNILGGILDENFARKQIDYYVGQGKTQK